MRCLFVCAFLSTVLSAVTLDRLAVTVGSSVITELQIDEDLRVAGLLNGQPIIRDADARRAAADRLIEQLLIQREIDLSRYPGPSEEETNTLYASVRQTLGGPERLNQLLASYDVSEQTLRAHLKAQLVTLRFIEFRFRPDITIGDSEIEAAYRQVPKVQAAPLDANERAKLSQSLLEERTDAALDGWLAESRKRVNIVYLDPALQ
jgi:hypothetical protein